MLDQKVLDEEIFNKMKSKNWDDLRLVFQVLHKKILSLNKNIRGKLYTIYIQYSDKEKVIAVVYYSKSGFDVGLALPNSVKDKKLKSAKYMRYPGITKCYMVKTKKDINSKLNKWLKISKENAL